MTLVLVLPLLLLSIYLTRKGQLAGTMLWAGIMLYVAYTYAIAAFHVHFNNLFLVYIVNLRCSFYGILWAITCVNTRRIYIDQDAPIRGAVIILCGMALVYGALWITDIATAIRTNTVPEPVLVDNVPTSAVEVLDLGFYVPMLIISAVLLWRRNPVGVVIGGMALTFAPLMGVAVVAMIINMARLNLIDSVAPVILFALTVIVSTVLLWHLLRYTEFVDDAES